MKNESIEERLGPAYSALVDELKLRLPDAYATKTQTLVLKEIAKKYNVGEVHIRTKILPGLGLKPQPKERAKTSYTTIKPTEEEITKIVNAYEIGTSAKMIFDTNLLGNRTPSLSTIINVLKRKSSKYKEKNVGKITELTAKRILDLHVAGETNQQISDLLAIEGIQVSSASVGNYLLTIGVDNSQGKSEEEKLLIYNEYIDCGVDGAYENLKSQIEKISKTTIRRIAREMIVTHKLPKRDNSDSYRTYTLDKNYFESIDTEAKAYSLGWLATDGNVCNNTVSIEIAREDEIILQGISNSIGSNKPISYFKHTNKETGKVFDSAKVTFFSKKMVKDLAKYGIVPAKSLTLNVDLNQVPKELHRHFWRGAIDGDGWVYSTGNNGAFKIELGLCGSLEMMKKFSAYLHEELQLNETVVKNHSIWKVVVDSEPRAAIALKHFYSNAAIALPRKLVHCT